VIPFALSLALMLYTHNWSLFFAAASLGALMWLISDDAEGRKQLIKDGIYGFGIGIRPVHAVDPHAPLPGQAHRGAVVELARHLRADAAALARARRVRAGDDAGLRRRHRALRGLAPRPPAGAARAATARGVRRSSWPG